MKSISTNWFLATIKATMESPEGLPKKTTLQYVVAADTFTECEARTLEEAGGDAEVIRECKAPFSEVFFDEENDGRWYKVKIALVTLDEATGKERKTAVVLLVQATSNEGAITSTKAMLKDVDFEITDVCETKIVDVFHKDVFQEI